MKPHEKIDQIQQELKQLTQRQVDLVKAQQQRVKSYEQQKTSYQQLFGQPPLPPDPELQAVQSQIEDLKEIRKDFMKVIQVHQQGLSLR